MIKNMCTPSRFRSSDKPSPSDDQVVQAVGEWIAMTSGMLTLDARLRLTATQLLASPLLAMKAATPPATNSPAGNGSQFFQRTQSVPMAEATAPTKTTTPKKLLLNPFRRVTSSGSSGGAPMATTTSSGQYSLTEKLGNLSTSDRMAPKGSAAYEREQAAANGLGRRPSLPTAEDLRNASGHVGSYKTASDIQGAKRR